MATNFKANISQSLTWTPSGYTYVNTLSSLEIIYSGTDYNMTYNDNAIRGMYFYVIWVEYSDTSLNSYKNNQVWRYYITSNQQNANEVIDFFNNTIALYASIKPKIIYDILDPNVSPTIITDNEDLYKSKTMVPNPAAISRTNTSLFAADTPTNYGNKPSIVLKTALGENHIFYSFPWISSTCTFGKAYATRIAASLPA